MERSGLDAVGLPAMSMRIALILSLALLLYIVAGVVYLVVENL